MVESKKRISLLGMLAILIGLAGAVLTRVQVAALSPIALGPVHASAALAIAAAGLVLGILALLGAMTSPRTGAGVPMAAVLACGGAVAVNLYASGAWRAMNPSARTAPVASPPAAVPPAPASQPAPATPPHERTIFDADFPSSAPPTTADAGSRNSTANANATADVNSVDPAEKVRAARAKLDAARANMLESLESSDGYRAAQAEVDAAEDELKKARAAYGLGTPELVAASQKAMEARARVRKMVADAVAKDQRVMHAQSELNAAQAAAKH